MSLCWSMSLMLLVLTIGHAPHAQDWRLVHAGRMRVRVRVMVRVRVRVRMRVRVSVRERTTQRTHTHTLAPHERRSGPKCECVRAGCFRR